MKGDLWCEKCRVKRKGNGVLYEGATCIKKLPGGRLHGQLTENRPYEKQCRPWSKCWHWNCNMSIFWTQNWPRKISWKCTYQRFFDIIWAKLSEKLQLWVKFFGHRFLYINFFFIFWGIAVNPWRDVATVTWIMATQSLTSSMEPKLLYTPPPLTRNALLSAVNHQKM